MKNCLAVKRNEKVLIVTDKKLLKQEAAVFFESAKKYAKEVTLVEISTGIEHAEEPPENVAEMMKMFDVSFLVTFYSLSHTKARLNACQNGARVASLPTITREIILRTLTIDYGEIAALSKKIAAIQTNGKKAVLTSKNGTNLTMSLVGRSAIADTGFFTNPGDFGNLPAGEAFIAPVEGKTNGVIIFDGCFGDIMLDRQIKVTVKNGLATEIAGGQAARLLNERLARVGKLGYNIAEFGIGTNKMAKLGKSLLEVEKVYGTSHIALGSNATFGGEVDVPFHSDGVILKPTIAIDDTIIIEEGEFKV